MEFAGHIEEALGDLDWRQRERLELKLDEFDSVSVLFGVSKKNVKKDTTNILRESRGRELSKKELSGIAANVERRGEILFREFREFYDFLSQVFGAEKTEELLYRSVDLYEASDPLGTVQADIWKKYIKRIVSGGDR